MVTGGRPGEGGGGPGSRRRALPAQVSDELLPSDVPSLLLEPAEDVLGSALVSKLLPELHPALHRVYAVCKHTKPRRG